MNNLPPKTFRQYAVGYLQKQFDLTALEASLLLARIEESGVISEMDDRWDESIESKDATRITLGLNLILITLGSRFLNND